MALALIKSKAFSLHESVRRSFGYDRVVASVSVLPTQASARCDRPVVGVSGRSPRQCAPSVNRLSRREHGTAYPHPLSRVRLLERTRMMCWRSGGSTATVSARLGADAIHIKLRGDGTCCPPRCLRVAGAGSAKPFPKAPAYACTLIINVGITRRSRCQNRCFQPPTAAAV